MNSSIQDKRKLRVTLILAVFILCVLSMDAFAAYVAQIGTKKYQTMQGAVKAAKTGETIKVLSEISTDKQIPISGKKITIDFARKKYTYKKSEGFAFLLNSGQLTLKNMYVYSRCGSVKVASNAKLIINNGSMTGYIENSGTMQVNNGKFQGSGSLPEDDSSGLYGPYPAVRNYGTLKVVKGIYLGKNRPMIENFGTAVLKSGTYTETNTKQYEYYFGIRNSGNMRIVNGTFVGTVYNLISDNRQLIIVDGKFSPGQKYHEALRNSNGRAIVTGGTFTSDGGFAANNTYDDAEENGGTLVISGGTFKATGNGAAIGNESELIITGGQFLLNGKKKGAIYCEEEYSKWYISRGMNLKVND